MNEVNLDKLDRDYDLGGNYIFRMGPRRKQTRNPPLLPEDDDVFLTQREQKLFFPRHFGTDSTAIARNRQRFVAPRQPIQNKFILFFTLAMIIMTILHVFFTKRS